MPINRYIASANHREAAFQLPSGARRPHPVDCHDPKDRVSAFQMPKLSSGRTADFQSVPVRRPILHGAHFIWSSTWVAYVAYIIHKAVRPTDVCSSAVEALSHLTLRLPVGSVRRLMNLGDQASSAAKSQSPDATLALFVRTWTQRTHGDRTVMGVACMTMHALRVVPDFVMR
ncbi:hypothetical protein AcV5_008239 [Taiwanofungus camphoratus]|nr:hypothetical protein AcV5_008239 [Antrodia cinnamomea]